MNKSILSIIAIVATVATTSAFAADTNTSLASILGGSSSGSTASGTTVAPATSTGTGVSTATPGTMPSTPASSLSQLLGPTTPTTTTTLTPAEKPNVSVQTRTASGDTVKIDKWNKDFRIELVGNGTFKRSDFNIVSINVLGVEQPVTDFSVSDVKNELQDGTSIAGKKIYLGLLQNADSVQISVAGSSQMNRIIRFINKDNGQIEEVYKFNFTPAVSDVQPISALTDTGTVVTQPGGDVKNTGIVDSFILPFVLGLLAIGGYIHMNRRKTIV